MAKLNKDFLRTLDALKEKYGEDFENLNGLGETQLSHTDFLDNFTKIKTVADASVDSSANVKQKDIVTIVINIVKIIQGFVFLYSGIIRCFSMDYSYYNYPINF